MNDGTIAELAASAEVRVVGRLVFRAARRLGCWAVNANLRQVTATDGMAPGAPHLVAAVAASLPAPERHNKALFWLCYPNRFYSKGYFRCFQLFFLFPFVKSHKQLSSVCHSRSNTYATAASFMITDRYIQMTIDDTQFRTVLTSAISHVSVCTESACFNVRTK